MMHVAPWPQPVNRFDLFFHQCNFPINCLSREIIPVQFQHFKRKVDVSTILCYSRSSLDILSLLAELYSKHYLIQQHLQHSRCCGPSLQTTPTWGPPSPGCRKSPGPPHGPGAGTRWTSWWLEGEKGEERGCDTETPWLNWPSSITSQSPLPTHGAHFGVVPVLG